LLAETKKIQQKTLSPASKDKGLTKKVAKKDSKKAALPKIDTKNSKIATKQIKQIKTPSLSYT